MKGVILAGGKGTRLYPLTAVTNKHLVSVGDLPMIEYPLFTLKKLGVTSINVVTGGEHFEDIARYLSKLHPDVNFSFHVQKEAGGIAEALSLVEQSVKGEKIAVILGDNVFGDDFYEVAKKFEESDSGAMVFLKQVKDPSEYGVVELNGDIITNIEEKPDVPKSDLAVTGLYLYDSGVFDKIRKLTPSARGELEVSDLNNLYVRDGKLSYHIINGFWGDAGGFESRKVCEEFVKKYLEREILGGICE